MNTRNLKNILLITIISAIVGFTYNHLAKNSLPLIREEIELKSNPEISTNTNTKGELFAISVDEAIIKYNNNEAIFIDARDNWDFGDGHILDAINIPEFSFEPTNEIITKLDKNQTYIIYCSSEDCDISKRLGKELAELGFTSLFVLFDGYEVWVEKGHPTKAGTAND